LQVEKPKFVGQREFRPGIETGFKYVGSSSNLVLEFGIRTGLHIYENETNNVNSFELKPLDLYLEPIIKIGYRFGSKGVSGTTK